MQDPRRHSTKPNGPVRTLHQHADQAAKYGYLSRVATPNPSHNPICLLSVPPLAIHSQLEACRPPMAIARHQITTYAMLTLELQLELFEEIRARRPAAALPDRLVRQQRLSVHPDQPTKSTVRDPAKN